jgi:hypothetical protein
MPSIYIVACTAVSRQWLSNHIPAATDMRTTIEVLLEMVLSTQSVPRCYNWDGLEQPVECSVDLDYEGRS